MLEITLTEEQARKVEGALGAMVTLRDPEGNVVGKFEAQLTPKMIAELKRRARAPGPRYSGQQVQARLQALQEEWDRIGGFDEEYMREFLQRLNEADPGHYRHLENQT